MSTSTPVIDYEGSQYKTDFWVNQGREYEDQTERIALGRLLPPAGRRIVEIGAGFGRLADLYTGYDQIVLFDYSQSLLQDAVRQWGDDPRFVFVAGNVYELPFASAAMDTLVMVRVMHHLANVPDALAELNRVTHKNSTVVLEYANKRNLKSLLRWTLGKQSWSPFTLEPYEFVELNFDFHPKWMTQCLQKAGFSVRQQLALSHFRLASLKEVVPTGILARVDNLISRPGGFYPLSPSVFVELRNLPISEKPSNNRPVDDLAALFCCPSCRSEDVFAESGFISCNECSASYKEEGRIWNFKEKV